MRTRNFLLQLGCVWTLAACTVFADKKHERADSQAAPALPPAAPMFGYNFLAFGNVTLVSSAVQGRLAAAGDAQLSNYSVGAVLPVDAQRCDLEIGGDLDFEDGSVYQGVMCVQGKMKAPGVGWKFPGSSVLQSNFAALRQQAEALSADLSALPADFAPDEKALNGARGHLILVGTKPQLNVFKLSAPLFAAANSIEIRLPSVDAAAVVNVSGTALSLEDSGIVVQGAAMDRVLFNFAEATSLALKRVNILGSIIAPLAAFECTEGTVNGSLVVSSGSGDCRFNLKPYTGDLTQVAAKL